MGNGPDKCGTERLVEKRIAGPLSKGSVDVLNMRDREELTVVQDRIPQKSSDLTPLCTGCLHSQRQIREFRKEWLSSLD